MNSSNKQFDSGSTDKGNADFVGYLPFIQDRQMADKLVQEIAPEFYKYTHPVSIIFHLN